MGGGREGRGGSGAGCVPSLLCGPGMEDNRHESKPSKSESREWVGQELLVVPFLLGSDVSANRCVV